MQDYQHRVNAEKAELDVKIYNLHGFLKTDSFTKLPRNEQVLLYRQSDSMQEYSLILKARIDLF